MQHYLPTLLASKGLDQETDCYGGMTFVHWWGDNKKMQPETFIVEEVCGDLIEQMRCSPAPPLPSLLYSCFL